MASALSLRTAMPVRVHRPAVRPRLQARRMVCMAAPTTENADLDAAIKEAERVSAESKTARQKADELSRNSNAAWEKVEQMKAASRDPNAIGKSDPLEEFCEGSPDADECRVYED